MKRYVGDKFVGESNEVKPNIDGATFFENDTKKAYLRVNGTWEELSSVDISGKQDKLTAGSNIDITSNVISATDTTYSNSDWNLKDLSDVDKTSIGIGKILKIGLDGVTHEYVDDESGTDEKVKYDASDPTAGYIADKIIAGTGISVAEGTGADENKLIITNDAPAPEETDPVWTSDKPSYALKTEALLLDQTTPQTITGGIPLLTNLTPSNDYDISTKKYVDDAVDSIDLTNYLTTTNNQIPVYTTESAAGILFKEISIDGSVETGQIIGVKLTNGNTVAANMRVRVNKDLPDAKAGYVYLGGSTLYNNALKLDANSVLYVQWDGTRWDVVGGTVAPLETNSFIPLHSELKAGATIYNYVFAMVGGDGLVYPLILTSSTSTTKPVSSMGFDISQGVMFNPGKGAKSTGANLREIMYWSGRNPSTAYALNGASGFNIGMPIYLKGTINQTDGLFYLERSGYNTWYTQNLPTTDDGYVYVLFATHGGVVLTVSSHNPAYWFKNGAVRPYGMYANTDRQDNFKEYFGTGNDASIYYDGTDLNINTKEVGSGTIKINGVGAFSGTFTTGDGKTVTVTDGIITSVV